MSTVDRRRFLKEATLGLGALTATTGRDSRLDDPKEGQGGSAQTAGSVRGSLGPELAGKYTVVMTEPPKHVPSGTVVDGPILGNGDLGVAMGGAPESQKLYFGKNDFWSRRVGSPMSVGGIALDIPDLSGGTYRQEQDLRLAEIRGTFTKNGRKVQTRTWVAATENLVVMELSSNSNISMTARLFPAPTTLVDNNKVGNLGREQYGDGRYYFNGLISDVHLYNRALSPDQVNRVYDGESIEDGLIRRWDFGAREGTTPVDTPTKMVVGPKCTGPIPILRPNEWPTNQPSGCVPDGYIYDYLQYSNARDGRGRAIKVMHSWNYKDVGPIPAVKEVTIAAWIYVFYAGDANFIFSKGSWREAYSLQLDCGRLRFNIGERFVRTRRALPDHQWVHVAGTYDGKVVRAFQDGQEVIPGARFVNGGTTDDVMWITRNADGPLDEQYPWPDPLPSATTLRMKGREVSIATRVIGGHSKAANGSFRFTVDSESTVYLVASVLSDLDNPHHLEAAKDRAASVNAGDIGSLNEKHRQWWKDFWSESFVEIGDPVIEKFYYASQYILASATREGKVAPGLYGPWITTDHSSWNGDYTLDYNYMTPFFPLYSSNHIITAGSYEPPIIAFMDRGEQYAKTMLNIRGVYYPGHIGPWGIERPCDYDPFMGMKQDAAFSAQPILMRFFSTHDEIYTSRVYPFIRKVGEFWEDYLKFQDGRYTIYDDCAGEVGPWIPRPGWNSCPIGDVNPMIELGFVRATFQGLIAMSEALGVDEQHRPHWQHILDHLSPFPAGERAGKTVFLGAENTRLHNRLSWGVTEAIWPSGQIGLGSDPELLDIARNTLSGGRRWTFPLFLPALARIGYDPSTLLKRLRALGQEHGLPNAYIFFGGGGIETSSTIPATINEMLLQSYEGVLRLFPVWPRDQDARFGNLRAYGAFLVSAEFRSGKVSSLIIESEKGRPCTLQNPWPGEAIVLNRNGRRAETLRGSTVTFKTRPDERIMVMPH